MATVPQLEKTISSQPIQPPMWAANATAADMGGLQAQQMDALGQGVSRFGAAMSQLGDQFLARREEADVLAGVAEFRDSTRKIMQGPGGVLTREGINARGATMETQEKLDKLRKEYSKRFVTPRAQEAWARVSNSEVERNIGAASQHETMEDMRYQQQSTLAHVESSVRTAVAARDNDATIEAMRKEIHADMQRLYAPFGDDKVAEQEAKALHKMGADIVDSYIRDEEFGEAALYIADHGSDMDPSFVAARSALINARVKDDEALAYSLEISSAFPTLEEQEDYINENITDAKEHDDVLARVTQNWNRKIAKENAELTARINESWDRVVAASKAGNDQYPVPQAREIGSQAMNQMHAYQQAQREARVAGRQDIESDQGLLRRLAVMQSDNPLEFGKMDPTTFRTMLNKTDYDKLKERIANPMTADAWKAQITAMGEASLFDAGWVQELGTADDDAVKSRFHAALTLAASRFSPGDRDAVQNWINSWMNQNYNANIEPYLKKVQDRTVPSMHPSASGYLQDKPSATPVQMRRPVVPKGSAVIPSTKQRPSSVPEGFIHNPAARLWEKRIGGRVIRAYDEDGVRKQ
jgi:type II secretory pathway pseudopilin PulG